MRLLLLESFWRSGHLGKCIMLLQHAVQMAYGEEEKDEVEKKEGTDSRMRGKRADLGKALFAKQ
ncbi:hypothetical protein SAMD00023353_1000410 [Rosellinia necatrix]|uniref:Uncharacterized protein n=1 Tax=Rosellinia necatrix TaxID=77044 RepID=A0A1S8A6S6_ROSNE|nr:hypothetical protein SAMD00023353_1000410 [Rosellinia necatrix]